MELNLIYLKDFYKVGHFEQYPKGTNLIFSNFTPRKSRMPGIKHSVFFGLQYFINKYLNAWNHFNPGDSGAGYTAFMNKMLGDHPFYGHIDDLMKMSHLPLAIYALPEGTVVPEGVPAMVMFNTHPDFYWLPGMLETILSCTLWGACTSATIAREYRIMLDRFAEETSDIPGAVSYQCHDFSMRGMFGLEAGIISGMSHLHYFHGTDNIPALVNYSNLYGRPLVPASIPATEHSVMSAGGKENEYETFERLITEVYPNGFVSIVSDTWDLWNVVENILPKLKEKIMARDGRVVIRPDSGDPVDIICGHEKPMWSDKENLIRKGLIECLWDIFGGTINSKGYKQLDPHIGAIYGDSITIERADQICSRLKEKGFASTNIVFGVGSYTYQYNTRDTLGWAMKSTYIEIDGVGNAITKDPITDDGTKKSHSGLLKVIKNMNGELECMQNVSWYSFLDKFNSLKLVYRDGQSY